MINQSATPAFLIHATYVIDPADTAAFRTIVTEMAEAARTAPGCLFLEATQSVTNSNAFHLIEAWTNQDAFDTYGQSDEFQAALGAALRLRIVERSGEKFFVSGRESLQMPQ